jgi:ABC-type branched-subunit amino acid transport system substrate-binding protein
MWFLQLVQGCSLSTTNVEDCQSNAECRAAFGWGSVCGEDGLCADVEPSPRCERTIPADLFENRLEYRDSIVLGSVYEREESLLDVMSFELAITQVNDSGGLDGHPFAFVQCTNEEDPALDSLTAEEANLAMALSLADEIGVPAIMGPSYSSRTQLAYAGVKELGTLMISPSATSPSLTALDDPATDQNPGRLWRTAPPDSIQGRAIALDATARGVATIAIVYDQDGAYAEFLATVVAEEFDGTEILLPFTTATDRDSQTAEAGSADVDEVLFVSSDKGDVSAFLNGAGAIAGFDDGRGIFLTDAAYDTNILTDARSAERLFPNIRGTRPATPAGDTYNFFLASFAAQYDGESAEGSGFTAYAYDAAWLVLYGSAWSYFQEDEVVTGTGIARGLRNVSQGPEVVVRPTSWNSVTSAFSRGSSIDVLGASGTLDYDPVTEETAGPIDLWTVQAAGRDFDVVCTFDPVAVRTLPAGCLPE